MITRYGLEISYLKGKEDELTVPKRALHEAIELIDSQSKQHETLAHAIYDLLEKTHPMVELPKSKLMVTNCSGNAFHRTGLYPFVEGEHIAIHYEDDAFYCGNGVFDCFIKVYFSKDSLREATEEEKQRYSR